MGSFGLLIALSLVVLGFSIYGVASKILEKNLTELSQQMNNQTVLFIDNYLARFSDVMATMASDGDLTNAVSDPVSHERMMEVNFRRTLRIPTRVYYGFIWERKAKR